MTRGRAPAQATPAPTTDVKKYLRCHRNWMAGPCKGAVKVRERNYYAVGSPARNKLGPDLKTCDAHALAAEQASRSDSTDPVDVVRDVLRGRVANALEWTHLAASIAKGTCLDDCQVAERALLRALAYIDGREVTP